MNSRRSLRLTASESTLKDKDDVTHSRVLRFQKTLSDRVLSPGTNSRRSLIWRIEPAQAAERAHSEDIALLRQSVTDLASSAQDRVKLVASDLLFRRAIFQASCNRLTGRIFHTTHRAMPNMIMVTSQLVDMEHTVAFHKPILAAIERRDAQRAAERMTAHLTDAANLLAVGCERKLARALRDHLASTTTKAKGRAVEPKRATVAKAAR